MSTPENLLQNIYLRTKETFVDEIQRSMVTFIVLGFAFYWFQLYIPKLLTNATEKSS
jgi:hypothetical protein